MEEPDRFARHAFALSVVSALVYFATSLGVHNFIVFVVVGVARLQRLLG
ncbi:MAG: hypothetical protein ABI277_16385 [Burkholderiaceae bacterium]